MSSPLDPFLVAFLATVGRGSAGYSHTADQAGVADGNGWDAAFVEGLFTSARRRGFLEAYYPRGGRGRYRWRLSTRGIGFLAQHGVTDGITRPES